MAQVEQILGRGAFKTVYKGFDEEEGIEVAWNQVRVSDLVSSKEERDRLFAEIRVLKQLKHKNIMTFYDSWLDPKTYTVNFITELFTSGTLRQCVPKSLSLVWFAMGPHVCCVRLTLCRLADIASGISTLIQRS